jgi:trans-aconitate methyltransferase
MEDEFYKTKETVDQYITATKGFDGKLLIEKLKMVLPANAKVLEIGSGPGSDWAILQETYKVIGSDNSKGFLAHFKNKYPSGDFIELDAVALNTALKFYGIYANKVLHHL